MSRGGKRGRRHRRSGGGGRRRARRLSRAGRDARLHARTAMRAACAPPCCTPPGTSRFSASASACRCCSSTARKAMSPGSASLPARCGAFRTKRWSTADGQRLKVPHMGWNRGAAEAACRCGTGLPTAPASISCTAITCSRPTPSVVTGTTDYGIPFTCAVARDNIFAVQFHPEKSAQRRPAACCKISSTGIPEDIVCPSSSSSESHAAYSRHRSQGRPVRPPQAGRDGTGHRVFRQTRPTWPGTGSTRARAACIWST